MKKLSIKTMGTYLNKLIAHNIQSSLMIWGPPGIGKSAIVSMVAKEQKIDLIDLRISQLAPTNERHSNRLSASLLSFGNYRRLRRTAASITH